MLLMIRCLCDIEFNNMMYINRPKKNEFIDNISAAPHYPFTFRLAQKRNKNVGIVRIEG